MQLPSVNRTRFLIGLIAVLGAIFVMRLFFLQVLQHNYYEAQAEAEHTTKFTIPATRGLIYASDVNGGYAPMVLNQAVFTVYADPRYVKDADHVADDIRRIAGGNAVDNFETGLKDKSLQYTVLARQVSKTQADMIKGDNLDGVGLQQETKRVYPEDQLASQTLGFVNAEGQGQYGIEEGLNKDLSGKDGQLKAVTDVHGIPISVGQNSVQTPPQNGKNPVLSIDINIQSKAEQILKDGLDHAKATKGSVLVMDPNNGHILAIANMPTYNPNDFKNITDYSVFSNRAVNDPYEPGSVIKALTMAAGLDLGIIQPDTKYNNTGSVQVDDALIKNATLYPQGMLTMTQVLQFSLNTGAVQVLKWMGGSDTINLKARQTLYTYLTQHFLFGKTTGVPLAGEVAGEVVSPLDAQGNAVRYANMSFGQGMNLSMLQVLSAFAACINGGTYYQPQIVRGYLGDDQKAFTATPTQIKKTSVISADASAKLRQMLHDAREGSTAAEGEIKGFYIGGKTGTAQVYNAQTGKYDDTATIGSYLGFGGQDKPQYVIMVRVDDPHIGGYSGSTAAAPIFTALSNWMLTYLQIQPKG